ncbi:CENP-B N-terminal DNA-binding domain [Popillia japonica]|uniref:CENP-B N-terminal DNA-binding domain n=1 Tax=Popillia japonica TaxID=7064 RepID=A0AAW1JE46_POPJA
MSPLKRKKLSSLLMNRDTPILRTVLGQGQADSSQPVSLVCHPDNHENMSNSIPEDRVERHLKNEPSEDAQSPYTDLTVMDEEEKPKMGVPSSSPQSYGTDMRSISSGIATYVPTQKATYVPTQKPEWKRYKQYSRNDIISAIDAVRNGMSALQAARKYGVPSRTLYDKVKKLGITTSRPFKRGSNGSSACFAYGISGTSSPYDQVRLVSPTG